MVKQFGLLSFFAVSGFLFFSAIQTVNAQEARYHTSQAESQNVFDSESEAVASCTNGTVESEGNAQHGIKFICNTNRPTVTEASIVEPETSNENGGTSIAPSQVKEENVVPSPNVFDSESEAVASCTNGTVESEGNAQHGIKFICNTNRPTVTEASIVEYETSSEKGGASIAPPQVAPGTVSSQVPVEAVTPASSPTYAEQRAARISDAKARSEERRIAREAFVKKREAARQEQGDSGIRGLVGEGRMFR